MLVDEIATKKQSHPRRGEREEEEVKERKIENAKHILHLPQISSCRSLWTLGRISQTLTLVMLRAMPNHTTLGVQLSSPEEERSVKFQTQRISSNDHHQQRQQQH